jgi:predicted ATPase
MTPLLQQLRLHNFLSFGSEGVSVKLLPLNVLIGPNASGKSNFLEALALLRGLPRDLQSAIREGGGSSEYIWKGSVAERGASIMEVDVSAPGKSWGYHPAFKSLEYIQHSIELLRLGARIVISHETIDAIVLDDESHAIESIYEYAGVLATSVPWSERKVGSNRGTHLANIRSADSILTQLRDPEQYPELSYLSDRFGSITLYQESNLGRRTAARLPQPTDLPSDFLLPDASNLALVLHDLGQTSAKREELIAFLRRFYEPARFIATKLQGGTLQLYVEEEGGRLIPATRLSDGTLRFLSLLAILCHPNPPPVIGIEEPELGLHPDILPTVAELLRKASERTQLFVTTHSEALVSALSDTPQSILVCEGTPDGTTMKRLDAEQLKQWLVDYSLGELWRMGEIGGNRW